MNVREVEERVKEMEERRREEVESREEVEVQNQVVVHAQFAFWWGYFLHKLCLLCGILTKTTKLLVTTDKLNELCAIMFAYMLSHQAQHKLNCWVW